MSKKTKFGIYFQPSSSLWSHELSGLRAFLGSGSVTADMFSFIHHTKARTDRGWRVFQPVKCASATFVYCAHKVQPYMRGQRLLVKNKMAMLSFAKRNISRQKTMRKPEKHSFLHGRSIIFEFHMVCVWNVMWCIIMCWVCGVCLTFLLPLWTWYAPFLLIYLSGLIHFIPFYVSWCCNGMFSNQCHTKYIIKIVRVLLHISNTSTLSSTFIYKALSVGSNGISRITKEYCYI